MTSDLTAHCNASRAQYYANESSHDKLESCNHATIVDGFLITMHRILPTTHALPYALYQTQQVRALDRCAIEQFGIAQQTLMERAGAALFKCVRDRWPRVERVAILAGTGNNGGDGYVLARLLHLAGLKPRLFSLGDHSALRGAAAQAAADYVASGGMVEPLLALPNDAELIVDALFGTGLTRPPQGQWAQAIAAANAHQAPVLAVDVPSGLNADSGRILGTAIVAELTLTFIGLKPGLFTAQGPDCCGAVMFDSLDVPARVYATQVPAASRIDWAREKNQIPPRCRSTHKGDCGHVLAIGGAPGMSGALRLCGEAALRTGAGRVTLFTHSQHAAWLNLSCPELMVQTTELKQSLQRVNVVAIGPGLGQDDWGQMSWQQVQDWQGPLVVDADALNWLARQPLNRDHWILTPHPGEAARLLGCSVADIEQDRFAAVCALQSQYGGVVVLKGAGTLIHAGPRRPVALCSAGNPGMASAGMGDALTGIISALLAQGLSCEQAARAGVCLHAAAADSAAQTGERGLLASDVIDALRQQWI